MEVLLHPEAEGEIDNLPSGEKVAMLAAVEKLRVMGDRLPFPHSSDVRGATKLRELRPRAGRSPWRGFYRRISKMMVIGAVGPEAESDGVDSIEPLRPLSSGWTHWRRSDG
jgi:hypothetical protein